MTYYGGYGDYVSEFIETYIVQSIGRWAGNPLILEPWQKDVLDEVFLMQDKPDGTGKEMVYRQALIGIARKNGKSTLVAALALWALVAANEPAPQVFAAAAASDQARIVFDQARKFVEASPQLRDHVKVARSWLECKSNGGVFRVLSSDGALQHGLNPSFVAIDELWAHKDPELYYALTTAQGARDNPLVVNITTAGWNRSSLLYTLYEKGCELEKQGISAMREARLFHRWFAADPAGEVDDREQWRKANPSAWVDMDFLYEQKLVLPEAVFRRLHLNQWTEAEESWIKPWQWDKLRGDPRFIPGAQTWLALDVGVKKDSTAILWGQWHDNRVHVHQTILVPPRPGEAKPIIGVSDVRETVGNRARGMAGLREIAYDPYLFRESAEELADRGLPMVEFPQNASRMGPACETLYELVTEGRIVHDGDTEFRDQILSAATMPTDRGGYRISKRKSVERVDACVALAMLVDRMVTGKKPPPRRTIHVY